MNSLFFFLLCSSLNLIPPSIAMLASIKSLALMALASSVAQAAVVTYNWNISYVNTNADGLFERRVIGVNGQFPYVLLPLSC